MQLSFMSLIIVLEVIFVLLLSTGFLLLRNRQLKQMLAKLKEKLASLLANAPQASEKAAPDQPVAAQPQEITATREKHYVHHISDQIEITKKYHESLSPDQDIALDLGLDNPIPRQVVALRYALLNCEKEAVISSSSKKPNWIILQEKLSRLIDFYTKSKPKAETTEEDDEHSEQLKKRIANLEKFKKLYFDLEKKWEEAQKQADRCYDNLNAYANEKKDQDLTSLVDRYQNSYRNFGNYLDDQREKASSKPKTAVVEIIRTDPKKAAEIKQLRSIAIDQQRVINELQKKIKDSNTDKTLAGELNRQLEQQNRFIHDAETCIGLLESELTTAMEKLAELESTIQEQQNKLDQGANQEAAVAQYAKDNKRLQELVESLHKENTQHLKALKNNHDPVTQKALDDLQAQYNELEEKYLELKMK